LILFFIIYSNKLKSNNYFDGASRTLLESLIIVPGRLQNQPLQVISLLSRVFLLFYIIDGGRGSRGLEKLGNYAYTIMYVLFFVFIFTVVVALSRHASLNPCSFARRNPCHGVCRFIDMQRTRRGRHYIDVAAIRTGRAARVHYLYRPTDRQTDRRADTDPNLVLPSENVNVILFLQPYSSYNITLL